MDKKIRVAFWHNSFAPYRVPLFQALAEYDDIDLRVYYGTAKDRHRQWQVDFGSGYSHILLPSLSIPGYPHKFNYTLLAEFLKNPYDVYIASENELGCQLTYLAARLTGNSFIVWSEEIDYQIVRDRRDYTLVACLKKMFPFIGRQMQKIIFSPFSYGAVYTKRHADACLAASQKTEEHLAGLGAKGPFFRHGSTVDTKHFRHQLQRQDGPALQRALGIEGKIVILSVSYLQKRKGVQYLIEAFLQLNHSDAVLVIVGDGEYKTELLKLLPEGREDILFVGHDENTAQYYAIADIFAMPSFSDPWGLTVNEAMLAGLPVITTSNVGAQELIQGNGYIIPPRDSAALETVLKHLVQDPELRREMGLRSQEIIQEYTIEHTAETCRAAIHAVLCRKTGRKDFP
ncbi:MAG: glycosyltransferase family 4 protein [bacterium]|nr:glycosyltransferase family 4 protein [bacterium]